MKPRIWHLATVGVLCVSVSGQLLADERGEGGPQEARPAHSNGGQQHGQQGQGGNNQPRQEFNQGRPQGHQDNQPRPENRLQQENSQSHGGQWQGRPQGHPDNSPRPENRPSQENAQSHGGQWQGRPQGAAPVQARPVQPGNNLSIQSRPDTVQQTQAPNRGGNQSWHGGGYYPGANNRHPNDQRWVGRPPGNGNGWGPGPQYRPGYVIDRFPGQYRQVPYRGQDYFFSGGYWYRPQGPRYIVVQPPYGIRVGYLPEFAREVWFGSTLCSWRRVRITRINPQPRTTSWFNPRLPSNQ